MAGIGPQDDLDINLSENVYSTDENKMLVLSTIKQESSINRDINCFDVQNVKMNESVTEDALGTNIWKQNELPHITRLSYSKQEPCMEDGMGCSSDFSINYQQFKVNADFKHVVGKHGEKKHKAEEIQKLEMLKTLHYRNYSNSTVVKQLSKIKQEPGTGIHNSKGSGNKVCDASKHLKCSYTENKKRTKNKLKTLNIILTRVDDNRVETSSDSLEEKGCNNQSSDLRVYTDFQYHKGTHTRDKQFECKICEKKFSLAMHLRIHDRTHKKLFNCEICGKKFSCRSGLLKHSRTYTGDKPINQCQVCGKRFSQSGTLKIHIGRHTGNKPFECQLCVKKFIRSADLKRHIRTHTGDKPFQCQVCGKKFSRNDHLQMHMSKSHKT